MFARSLRLGEGQGRRREAGSGGKPNPKVQGDEQEPDLRCGTSGTSGHVTTKSSIRKWGVLYKSGVYAQKSIKIGLNSFLCMGII